MGEKVHTKDLIRSVQKASGSLKDGETTFGLNQDNYENQFTFLSSKVAVDAVITAADAILSKTVKKAYALVRPPGHHAHPD